MPSRGKITSPAECPTIQTLYEDKTLRPSTSPHASASSAHNTKISLWIGDITKLSTGAIVNAANESLLGGGGVDGAIHRAAGPALLDECARLDGCTTGDAKITAGHHLPAHHVIHAVGPVYRSTKARGTHTALLQGCYRRALELCRENGVTSVAFPCISTGVYGYPHVEAARAACEEVKRWCDADAGASRMERIVFCCFLGVDEEAYRDEIPKFFTPASEEGDGEKDFKEADLEDKGNKA